MKIKIHLLAAVLLLSAFCFPLSAFSQGSLTPPGAPAPTMKTLAQIEPRTPISSAPFIITAPGAYYLSTNLTVSGGDAITIAANGVTLDLNGFKIASTAASAAGTGISINNVRNLAILNGFIQGGVTNNGSGVYSGSGFWDGIYGYPVQNARVSGVSVSGCSDNGIYLGNGDATVVESCTVRTVGGYGIVASTIKASVATDCGGSAIYGDQVADCRGECTGSGYGLYATTALNCYGSSSAGSYALLANTAQNCYGSSSSGSYGLTATTALNCYGSSSSTGTGLSATSAQNCRGSSSTGTGLSALTAQNCSGSSSSGYGLSATTAQNCYGSSSSGIGVNASDIAIGCVGSSFSGTGLNAYSANSCRGTSSTGTGLAATYGNFCFGSSVSVPNKYNMP
jgi:hypothetical protein